MGLRYLTAMGCAGLAALVLSAPAGANTINADPGTDTPAPGACTLREAVSSANGDAVVGACEKGDGADVIMLPAGSYALGGSAGENANAGGDLDVTSDISFVGAGAGTTTVDGAQIDRVFDIQTSKVVSISGITISGGKAPTSGGDGGDGENGGGIRNVGNLTLDSVIVENNRAGAGGNGAAAAGGDGGRGGGIFSSSASLTVTNSVIRNNQAGTGGTGAAGAAGGRGGNGGGIFANFATVTNTTITANQAGAGVAGGAAAAPEAGGIGGDGGGFDGGINARVVTVALTRVTV